MDNGRDGRQHSAYQQGESRPDGFGRAGSGQQADQRAAYERAYKRYMDEQARAQEPQQGKSPQPLGGPQAQAYRQPTSQQATAYRQSPSKQAAAYRNQGRQMPASYQRPVNTSGAKASGRYVSRDGQNWQYVPKKSHKLRNVLVTLLLIIVIVGGLAGFTGYTLYNSAQSVRSDATIVMADINDLKDQILSSNPEQANATASDIAKRAKNMKDETSGWAWSVASFVPTYGSDVAKVRELSGIMDDLAKNAIVPLISEVSQVSLKNLFSNGAVNVELAQRVVSAVDSAAPVIESATRKLETMGDANLEQINGPLEKARDSLGKLNAITEFVDGIAPTFADMMGADGRVRTYLVVAQNNSEIRSTGGFLGSVGPLNLDNGRIAMGDFRAIYEIYPDENDDDYAPLTEEEVNIFGRHVSYQIADSNFIPDFARVSEIVKYAWERKGLGQVDGVIGVDPVFLQDMLAITGPVTTSNGTVVDGSNAARLLLHDAYYLAPELQDPFFEEVAALSFANIMNHLGDISLPDFAKKLNEEMSARRLQVWMANPSEEEAIIYLGCDGKLSHDAANPTLGVYLTDESYSKLFWYVKLDTFVGEPVVNPDGTRTYPVSMSYANMLQPDQLGELSEYMAAHNLGLAHSPGDMIAWVMLSAPEGGRITDVVCNGGDFIPEGTKYRDDGSYVSGYMTESTLQGLNFWYGLTRTDPGATFSLSFNVTTAPGAEEPLRVVRTPTAQEVAGW